ncbi:MAG: substrate-binding domain-containing protein [Anaerolineae bacterium]|jgi:ribose transport system substrate-binding protein|nr:substrate-binding domain-containing protein [Chloroflexota bacterium]NPV40950.1 substrate-binding domain-containing protein [Anaerolineae bacterium]
MKEKKCLLIVLALLTVLIFNACSSAAAAPEAAVTTEETTDTTEASDAETEKLLITAVVAEVGIPYFTTMHCGAMAAAAKYNVELNWAGPAEWDFNKQQPFIDGALALEPDAMIIVPTDPDALVAYVKEWMEKGIPVVTADVTLSEPVELMGIESDQYSGGVEAAKAVFEMTGGEGSYYTVGTTPGSYGSGQRVAGFIDTMKELNPNAKMLETCYAHHDATKSAECVSAAIIGNPDLKGVYVAVSSTAAGAASAIIEQGKAGDIVLVSYDADPQQVQDLKAGVYGTLIAQDPYKMGWLAVETLAKYLRGEITKEEIPQHTTVGMAALTQANIGDTALLKFQYVGDVNLCPNVDLSE